MAFLVATALALVGIVTALAVHDDNTFQFDGTINNTTGNGLPDWGSLFTFNSSTNTITFNAPSTTFGTVVAHAFALSEVGNLPDQTAFLGSDKNSQSISTLIWGTSSNQPKDQLSNSYAYEVVAPSTSTDQAGHRLLYLGTEFISTSGDKHLDIELYQADVHLQNHAGTTTNPIVPPCDIKPCSFSGSHTQGDLLITIDYTTGGKIGSMTFRTWNCTTSSAPGTPCDGETPTTTGSYSVAATFGNTSTAPLFCSLGPVPQADEVCAAVNATGITPGSWPSYDLKGQLIPSGGTLSAFQFSEFGVDLTEFYAGLGIPTIPCTRSVSFKTRASGSSFDSTLSDFALLGFNTCTASIATTVKNAADNSTVSAPLSLGSSVYDTATITTTSGGGPGPAPTGTVTYTFFTNGTCSGTGTTETKTISGGLVPNSSTHGPLTVGSYSFKASWPGDSNYTAQTSSCEPFSVAKAPTTLTTTVQSGGSAVSGPLALGSSVTDTATLSGEVDSIVPTGTVTYTFFTNSSCTGTGTSAGGGSLVNGSAPNSSTEGPLAAGSYGFQASYSGDSNYLGSTSSCEPFSVAKAPTTSATTLKNAADNSTIPNNSTVPFGTSVYDTATVSGEVNSFVPSGTVTYSFFTTIDCSGTGTTQTVTLTSSGAVPNSSTHGPLSTGSYSFQASYIGDSNYLGSTSSCEPFKVGDTTSETSAQVWLPNDSAMLSSGHGSPLNGTLSFTLYPGTGCSGTPLRPAESFTFTNATSPQTASTTNSTVTVAATQAVSWLVQFVSSDPNVTGSSHCESTSLTITN